MCLFGTQQNLQTQQPLEGIGASFGGFLSENNSFHHRFTSWIDPFFFQESTRQDESLWRLQTPTSIVGLL